MQDCTNQSHIDLSGKFINVDIISKELQQNKSLTHLNLYYNKLETTGLKKIMDSLEDNNTLTHLNISRNNIKNEGAMVKKKKTSNSKYKFYFD